jgi:1,4-alpha-glucan branching enzyme
VFFTFDGVRYDNVEDIPNTTARQLVQDAIKEWEETV